MHIGGACSNDVIRSAEPSAGGHGVSPVIAPPGIVVAVDAVLPVVVSVDAAVVLAPAAVVPVDTAVSSSSSLPNTWLTTNAPAMNTTRRIAPRMIRRLRFADACSASWASRRA